MEQAAQPEHLQRLASIEGLLESMTAHRAEFVQFFDAYLTERRVVGEQGGWPVSHLDALLVGRALLGVSARRHDPRRARDAAALALLALPDTSAVHDVVLAAVAAGLFDPADGEASVAEARGRAASEVSRRLPGQIGEGRAGLERAYAEAATSPHNTLPDPDRLYPALLLARKRLCRVDTSDSAGKTVIGTGFLIGPSAILTNWHVVQDVPSPRRGHPLRVTFDYGQTTGLPTATRSVVEAADEWRIAHSETGLKEPVESADGWWMDDEERRAWRKSLGGTLDFAVIRLEGAPGIQRGWYDLAQLHNGSLGGSCFALHHPNGQGRTITAGEICLEDPQQGARIFHTATTQRGSSGGLIIDDQARPAALHYLGIGKDAFTAGGAAPKVPDEVVNAAIPLRQIADKLAPHAGELNRLDGLSVAQGCLGDKRPVFGREGLLTHLADLRDGKARVLWVRPPSSTTLSKLGKSFSVDIIQALFPPPDNLYVKVTADQVRAGGRETAAMILRGLSKRAADDLPAAESTEAANERVLIARLRQIISDRWPKSIIWLIIDDLDVHDLTDSGGRSFLNALYADIATIPQLRIVLIGLKVRLDAIPRELLVEDVIDENEIRGLADLFKKWLALRGVRDKPIDEAVQDMIAEALASHALADAPLEALSTFTQKHLEPALAKFLGR